MTLAVGAGSRDRLAVAYGWIWAAVFAFSPLFAWLGPLSFAPVVALAGLLCLPALRLTDDNRPLAIALLVAVIWAAGSMLWSPYRVEDAEGATALKLAVQALFYMAGVCGAARASDGARTGALRVFAWAMTGLGVLLFIEGLTGAAIYQALRNALGDPIRPDLAAVKVAQGAYVLAVLWAPAALAASRVGPGAWAALPIAGGVVAASLGLGADAPLSALVLSLVAAVFVWKAPRLAPRALAGIAAVFFLAAPLLVWGARQVGLFDTLQSRLPESWAQRMTYWRLAVEWIGDHVLRGWGLDASRMFGPGIHLHPHDAALQIWLELGLIGAVAAAVFWAALFLKLGRDRPDPAAAASVGAATAYLVIGAVSFGVWQEWWLAVGGLAAAACAALQRESEGSRTHRKSPVASPSSTIAPISE